MGTIRAVARTDAHIEDIADLARISDFVADREVTVWVDILEPDDAALRLLGEEFAFHPLTIEDVVRRHQRPKVEIYADYYFIIFYAVDPSSTAEPLRLKELAIFLGPNYVVTAHTRAIHEVDEVWQHWHDRTEMIGSDVGALLYGLLDHIVDDHFPVIDALAERVELIEQKIFENFSTSALQDVFQLKKDLLALRRFVAPERDVLNVLLRGDPPILPAEAIPFFQNIFDHILRVLDSVDTYRDLVSSALDAYLSVQSNNLNEVMRRLTVISTIFLPLMFLTGFFGMNFDGLPFKNPLVFWLSLAVMLLTPVLMMVYFRWRGWS